MRWNEYVAAHLCQCSMAQSRITGGKVKERKRNRGGESGREEERGHRRGRSPLDPEPANSNITIRPPGPERRRTLRLPPSSYVLAPLYPSRSTTRSILVAPASACFVPLFLSLSPRHPARGRLLPVTAAHFRFNVRLTLRAAAAQTPPTNAFSLGADEMADEKTFSTLATRDADRPTRPAPDAASSRRTDDPPCLPSRPGSFSNGLLPCNPAHERLSSLSSSLPGTCVTGTPPCEFQPF